MTLASAWDADGINQRRPQSAASRLRQTHKLDENNPYKDHEFFGQHLLKSRRDNDSLAQAKHESNHNVIDRVIDIMNVDNSHNSNGNLKDVDSDSDEFDEDSSEAVQMAVASAEEYAAKITKLQQSCLIPLKEDLADWLNKILKTSQISTVNFMDKLDNGVIICRLAKIISLWCKQQLDNKDINPLSEGSDKLTNDDNLRALEPISPQRHDNTASTTAYFHGPLRAGSTSRSTNCLIKTSASATSLNNGSHLSYHSNQFLNNLIRMHLTKIWEDAKCRTFYARDNVCNFIKWCRDFGVNRSVIFESDDLVLHANPRQVVLCLLDVARIAYIKYGFTEAPGLVKFEQEIDRELQKEGYSNANNRNGFNGAMKQCTNTSRDSLYDIPSDVSQSAAYKKNSSRVRASIGDATDELVMRYCRHKEEEAARKKKQEELEKIAQEQQTQTILPLDESADSSLNQENSFMTLHNTRKAIAESYQPDSLMPNNREVQENYDITSSTDIKFSSSGARNFMVDHGRVDSLDSGEGPTDSASTAHSGGHAIDSSVNEDAIDYCSKIPEAKQRTRNKEDLSSTSPSHPTTSTSVTENSELSSSRSSLLSNQECDISNSNYGRQITSDLDGKVMRIAKSYYGKKATRDVTRLSEGKYKIADRIVFVRLLKGHRVMVRIGGGWDTLENFLFRHKSDPTQVIDPDNLLPIETKISLEKSSQVTPKTTPSRSPATIPKVPNYRRSNSASSTNLSITNLSYSNISLASSNNHTPMRQIPAKRLDTTMSSYNSTLSVDQTPRHQIPRLLIHKGQPVARMQRNNPSNIYLGPRQQNYNDRQQIPQVSNAQATFSPGKSSLRKPQNHSNNNRIKQRTAMTPQHGPTRSMLLQRPLASSKAPTLSVTNLYPATLTTNRTRH